VRLDFPVDFPFVRMSDDVGPGRNGGGVKRERAEGNGEGAERLAELDQDFDEDSGDAGVSPLQLQRDELARLKALANIDLQLLVNEFNAFLKGQGYRKLHKKDVRASTAYFRCACGRAGCFLVNFARSSPPKGGRKDARLWTVRTIGAHLCEPHEPRGVAIDSTFIPVEVKALLVSLFDQGIGASAAHNQALEFAAEKELLTTWEPSDVKSFFVTLEKMSSDTDTLVQLEALAAQGHFVALDIKLLHDGRRVLNLAFVAFKSMQLLQKLFPSFATLDSTYGKNNLQLPLQFIVGLTNEGCIVPFGVGWMRSETLANYTWLVESYYTCYKMLPATMIVDGDKKLRDAIEATARLHDLIVIILLCVWHLFCDLEKNLVKKVPGVDVFALKKGFYELRACPTEEVFDATWASFLRAFGTNAAAATYLRVQLFDLRRFWAQPWTGSTFCGGLATTGISESLHALLASGHSACNSLTDVLVLVDRIIVRQSEKSLRLSAKHERHLEELSLADVSGFVTPSVAPLLSGYGLDKLLELNAKSCFYSVTQTDQADAFVERSWLCGDKCFLVALQHTVSEIVQLPVTSAQSSHTARVILDVLSKNVDLGHGVCACCHTADGSGFDLGYNFRLPARWELLYQGKYERERICRALGFNVPKEPGSTNNTTLEGLLDVITEYQAERDRQLAQGVEEMQARLQARDWMRHFRYGNRELGTPRYKEGAFLQCGVVAGEDSVPVAEERNYCGLWHCLSCTGLVSAPKDPSERVQCLQCLSDRRFRPKPLPIDHVSEIALWDARGRPRILENEAGSRVSTLYLTCSCGLAVGTGLPCEGMLAVARSQGAVLSYRLYHQHWFGCKLINFTAPVPVFNSSNKLQLNIDAVINHVNNELAPSTVPAQLAPRRAVVQQVTDQPAKPTLVLTIGGEEQEGATLAGVDEGDAKSSRKKSRRSLHIARRGFGPTPVL
jgi:hypothetical protein